LIRTLPPTSTPFSFSYVMAEPSSSSLPFRTPSPCTSGSLSCKPNLASFAPVTDIFRTGFFRSFDFGGCKVTLLVPYPRTPKRFSFSPPFHFLVEGCSPLLNCFQWFTFWFPFPSGFEVFIFERDASPVFFGKTSFFLLRFVALFFARRFAWHFSVSIPTCVFLQRLFWVFFFERRIRSFFSLFFERKQFLISSSILHLFPDGPPSVTTFA